MIDFNSANLQSELCPFEAYIAFVKEQERLGALGRDREYDDDEIAALLEWDAGLDRHPDDGELDHEQWDFLCRAADRARQRKVHKPVEEQNRSSQSARSRGDFLKALFASTSGSVYTCSFTNERAAGPERHLIGRSATAIDKFLAKWDKPGRGAFICVGTLKEGAQRRAKENIAETTCLHADIDFKDFDSLGEDPAAFVRRHLAPQISAEHHR